MTRELSTFSWLAIERVARLVVGVVVTSWFARVVGPYDFGAFAYAYSWIALLSMIAGFGMENLVIRDLITRPDCESKLLGTFLVIRLTFCVLTIVGVIIATSYDQHSPPASGLLILILGFGLLLQTPDSLELWFQARQKVPNSTIPRLGAYLVINLTKAFALYYEMGVIIIVALYAAESALFGLVTFLAYQNTRATEGNYIPLLFDRDTARRLILESWPLACSGILVAIYMRTGQLMVTWLLGEREAGIYYAAVRLSEACYFLPAAISAALLPRVLAAKREGITKYKDILRFYLRVHAASGLAISLPLSVLAPWITSLLYGPEYSEAALVLRIHAWSALFAFMGFARGQVLLNDRHTFLALRFTAIGVVTSTTLLLLTLPERGVAGAAISVLVAQIGAGCIATLLFGATRELGREQLFTLVTAWAAIFDIRRLRLMK